MLHTRTLHMSALVKVFPAITSHTEAGMRLVALQVLVLVNTVPAGTDESARLPKFGLETAKLDSRSVS